MSERIRAALKEAQAERDKLLEVVAPLRAQRDALVAQMVPLEARARELANQIKQHLPRLAELDMEISGLARALGGRRLVNEGPAPAQQ